MSTALPSDPPFDAPATLKNVWPLVLRWGEADDVERGTTVESSDDAVLKGLVEAVAPLHEAINAYLDDTQDAERAVPFGDLAQAALEAQQVLDRRAPDAN